MNDHDELKACPWCNRKPVAAKVALPMAQLDETMRWTAGCEIHYQVFAATRGGAIAAWNHRPGLGPT
jgi:hypothetical protein